MFDLVDRVIDWLLGIRGPKIYGITGALAAGETAIGLDVVVPGEVGMAVMGTVGQNAGLHLVPLIAVAAAGAVLGDSVSYWLGRQYGERVIERVRFLRRHLGPRVDRAHEHFEERGGAALFVGRFVGALRAVLPAVAGIGGMEFPRFLAWNVAASIAWAGTVVSLGWFVGRTVLDGIQRYTDVIGWTVLGLLAGYLAYRWMRRGTGQ